MSTESVDTLQGSRSRGVPKREIAVTFAVFLVLIGGMIGYNVRATAAMGRTALLVNVSSRQSLLARRYSDEVLYQSKGLVADPGPDRALLERSAEALLNGGATASPLSGSTKDVQLPEPRDWKLVRKLTQEVALINDMTRRADRLLKEGPAAGTYAADLFAVRLAEARLETVANDSTYQMTMDVRTAGVHLQRVEVLLGLLSALAGLAMAGLLVKTATRQSARFRSLVHNAWDMICVTDGDLKVSYITPSSDRVLGYPPGDLQGEPLTGLIHPDDIGTTASQLRQLDGRTGATIAIETRMRHRDGAWRTIAWTATNLLTDPTVRGYVFNGGDVTDARQAAEDLAVARDQALTGSRAKSEFLATMSHEIRTPMNAVIGLTELLIESGLDSDQHDLAAGVQVSAENLLTIINDILDFSKIEAGKIDLEEVELSVAKVADDVGRILAEGAHAKGIELLVDVHPDVTTALLGDPVRLQQILLNLGSNAVKFTSEGEVLLRVKLVDQNAVRVALRFELIDTGIGIAKADLERLFRPFAQADSSTTRRFGGTGLGLAISRQLVELMGGELSLKSTPGKGSTFWFDLSLARADHAVATDNLDDVRTLTGLRALVVDDNATNRMILRQQLLSWGVWAVEASDGIDALRVAAAAVRKGQPFDLAVLDLNMPGMDGIELASTLKADPDTASVTLFLLSSSGQRLNAAESHLHGLAGNMTKPVRQSELFDCLISGLNGGLPCREPGVPVRAPTATPVMKGLVLVVEDNKMNQLVASKMLAKLGFSCEIANHGGEAVAALAAGEYDAVLMDCQMPEMDGYQATAEIRRIEGTRRHTPIIAMTAAAMEGDRETCLAAGMDDYITKPVRTEAIAAALQRWIAQPLTAVQAPLQPAAPSPDATGLGTLSSSQIEVLRSLDDGEGAVLDEIIQQYLVQTGEGHKELARIIAEGDASALERSAHAIKGASANVGAIALADICAEMEARGRFRHLDGTPELLARFGAEFARVEDALHAASRRS